MSIQLSKLNMQPFSLQTLIENLFFEASNEILWGISRFIDPILKNYPEE